MTYIPFSYGMPNFTSQFSSSIPTSNHNPSIGLGGMAPPHIPHLFGAANIPQKTPTVGIQPPFHPVSNHSHHVPGWRNQLGEQVVSYDPYFTPTSSTLISTKMFNMKNLPLSSGFPPRGGQFHNFCNPQHGDTLVGGNVYNPHHNIPTGMVPNQPLVNQFGGGVFKPRQGHGAYHNPVCDAIPQHQYF
jgi:hypothetical protein